MQNFSLLNNPLQLYFEMLNFCAHYKNLIIHRLTQQDIEMTLNKGNYHGCEEGEGHIVIVKISIPKIAVL